MNSPVLTLVVPCYNSADYMRRCLDSLLAPGFDDVDIIVVDDGSTDGTASIAAEYVQKHPTCLRVVTKENGGHGSAINAGLVAARGTYFKVVDSDDWLDEAAFRAVHRVLSEQRDRGTGPDLLVTNFVYEKFGKRRKRSVHYRRALPPDQNISWDQVQRFWVWQYMLMHSMIYRTGLLRKCRLHVPENSFYVDNYFAFVPLPLVQTLRYLDVNLYRYFIGRCDQSVNESVMIGRIEHQINVNLLMVEHLAKTRDAGLVHTKLDDYMTRYATLVTAVSSVLLIRHGTGESRARKRALWDSIDRVDRRLGQDMRRPPVGAVVSRTGWTAEVGMRLGYHLSKILVGYN